MAMGGVDANLGIDSEIGVDAESRCRNQKWTKYSASAQRWAARFGNCAIQVLNKMPFSNSFFLPAGEANAKCLGKFLLVFCTRLTGTILLFLFPISLPVTFGPRSELNLGKIFADMMTFGNLGVVTYLPIFHRPSNLFMID